MTVQDFMKELDQLGRPVSKQVVYQWIYAEKIKAVDKKPPFNIRSQWHIDESEVEKFK